MNWNICTNGMNILACLHYPKDMNTNGIIHYFVDVGGVEEQIGVQGYKEPNEDVNEEES